MLQMLRGFCCWLLLFLYFEYCCFALPHFTSLCSFFLVRTHLFTLCIKKRLNVVALTIVFPSFLSTYQQRLFFYSPELNLLLFVAMNLSLAFWFILFHSLLLLLLFGSVSFYSLYTLFLVQCLLYIDSGRFSL